MSVSKKQLIANRANALKSTGPNTDEGKDTISQNAVKHGFYCTDIIVNSPHLKEDPAEYELLLTSLFEELKPQTLLQEHLVRKIANSLWRSRRLIAAETARITQQLDTIDRDYIYVRHFGHVIGINDPGNKSIPPEDKNRAIANAIGMKSIPDETFGKSTLRYEMRLDRQLSIAYRLLRFLQKGIESDLPPASDNET
jgi:hypothetical protein